RDRDAARREERAVGELAGGARGAGDAHVEGEGVGALRAEVLADVRGLARGDAAGDGGRALAADRADVERAAGREGEGVAELGDAKAVHRAGALGHARAVAGEAAVTFPRDAVSDDRGGRARGEDVAAPRAEPAAADLRHA